MCLNTWSPVLVLFWKVVEPLGEPSLKEVGHWVGGWILRFYDLAPFPVPSLHSVPPRCEEVRSASHRLLSPWSCLLPCLALHSWQGSLKPWAQISFSVLQCPLFGIFTTRWEKYHSSPFIFTIWSWLSLSSPPRAIGTPQFCLIYSELVLSHYKSTADHITYPASKGWRSIYPWWTMCSMTTDLYPFLNTPGPFFSFYYSEHSQSCIEKSYGLGLTPLRKIAPT